MSDHEQVVTIDGEQVLIFTIKGKWRFRGADWSSHMPSSKPFESQQDAIEHARRYFARDGGDESNAEDSRPA